MNYLIPAGIIFLALWLILLEIIKRKSRKRIEHLRSNWGKPKTEYYNFPRISDYANRVKESEFHQLTEQTIQDIDFYSVFKFIDRTTSRVGQQVLFRKVTEPSNSTKDDSERLVNLFSTDSKLREEIQLELLKLNGDDAYHISSLIAEKFLERPKWFIFLIVDVVIVVCLFISSIKFPGILILLLVPLVVNMILHYWNKKNINHFIKSFQQLSLLINVSKSVSEKRELFYDNSIAHSVSDLKTFQYKVLLIIFDHNNGGIKDDLSFLGTYLFELIKAFFLIEFITFFVAIEELKNKQSSILSLFNYIGNIDASISIASLRADSLKTCQPLLISSGKELSVKNMYHPLIESCVENNLSIHGKSILITGSNMSGKTTFLRTLTINSILAQTIYTCFADEFVSPILRQFSSIRIDDSLFEGKSFYFQEVNIIASLIEEVNGPYQNLFILDEVFKGTNTIERIAAAKAILSYLNRNNNIVIVSTHDIELSEMLGSEYDLYHFTETIENNELHFDHKIKSGQLRTRNAVKLLELSNYPEEIIQEAERISSNLTIGRR